MRFIFSIMVILFHCNRIFIGDIPNKGYEPGLMPRGYIAVEFFFMVSGFLMAKSVVKSNAVSSGQHLGKGYIKFMWGKVSSLLPYHMVAVICMLIMDIITKQNSLKEEFLLFLDYIPSILFLQKTGERFTSIRFRTLMKVWNFYLVVKQEKKTRMETSRQTVFMEK